MTRGQANHAYVQAQRRHRENPTPETEAALHEARARVVELTTEATAARAQAHRFADLSEDPE